MFFIFISAGLNYLWEFGIDLWDFLEKLGRSYGNFNYEKWQHWGCAPGSFETRW